MTAVRPGADAEEFLLRARRLTGPALRDAVRRLPEPTRGIAEYHFSWDHGQAGKSVRAALVLAAAEALHGPPEDAVSGAAGVELVHNFSLIHDDLMDRDPLRRTRPTVWSAYGDSQAILTGDALLVVAMHVLADHPPVLREVCAALLALVDGQSADLAFESRTDVGLDECVRMAALKTGALLASSCAIGGMLARAEPARVEALRRFGHHLGLAFQLVDDILGIWGQTQVSGKPVGADLRRRKKSLPVVAALNAGGSHARRLREIYHPGAGPLDDDDIQSAAELIELAGGRAWAERQAEHHRTGAMAALAAAEPTGEGAEILVALATLVCRRDR
ncbi:polyprenyl synthetase family protein [Mangrovihabitans endophyticus]|uniref:Polyprenyl synthetase n=1 Tax=Mangrovihabitans endophyticus TaxID=1751298 RepID=A0A8J3BX04_9ACTN|nr:polyprenyl synthetase family protein [Mangrovihabitans endophyticus]GGK79088.1 polyprenyl synthetase [Mangrovihabitans endophyticus]